MSSPIKKRGRPRKNKELKPNDTPTVTKRRGRKRKYEKEQIVDFKIFEEAKQKSKIIIQKSIIVHLPLNFNDIEHYDNDEISQNNCITEALTYNPNIEISEPEPYNDGGVGDSMFIEMAAIPEEKEYTLYECETNKVITKKINKHLLPDFVNFQEKKYLKTDICCWWCCHKFDNMPCGIPTSVEDGIFNVRGIFCSFNCALSHNYSSKETINTIQEQESLLYLLYKRIFSSEEDVDIEYAPEKETLKLFGGALSIEDFRKNNKKYNMIYPPISYIIPHLEELDFQTNKKEEDTFILSLQKGKAPKRKKMDMSNLMNLLS